MPPLYVQAAVFARDEMPGYLALGFLLLVLLWLIFDPFGLVSHVVTQTRVSHFADVTGLADLRYAVGRLLSGIPGGYTRNTRRERQLNDKSYMTLIARNHLPSSPGSAGALGPLSGAAAGGGGGGGGGGDGPSPPRATVRASLKRDIGEERAIRERASPPQKWGGSSSPASPGGAAPCSPAGGRSSPAGGRSSPLRSRGPSPPGQGTPPGQEQGTSSSPLAPPALTPLSRASSPARAPSPQAILAAAMPSASAGRWLPRGAPGEPGREIRGAISHRPSSPPLPRDASPPQLYSWRGYETPRALTDERRHML